MANQEQYEIEQWALTYMVLFGAPTEVEPREGEMEFLDQMAAELKITPLNCFAFICNYYRGENYDQGQLDFLCDRVTQFACRLLNRDLCASAAAAGSQAGGAV